MTLKNKLGITNSPELAEAEERISKKKAAELFENGLLDNLEVGTFASLKAIHKYLFDEIYDFAGKLRTVNISKGNFRFAPLMYLEAALVNIDKMPQSTSPIPSVKATAEAHEFGLTVFLRKRSARSSIGVRLTKKIIYLLWSAARLRISRSSIS